MLEYLVKNLNDLDNLPKWGSMTFHFYRNAKHSDKEFTMTDCTGAQVCQFNANEVNNILESVSVNDFEMWKQRPEYQVALIAESTNSELSCYEYQTLIAGCMMIRAERAGKDPDTYIPFIKKGLSWLETSGFYAAPASSQYHDSVPGGLVHHSLKVYNETMEMLNNPKFSTCDFLSAAVISLVHDWCKIGLYESYMRNVKNEQTGQWEQVLSYRINQKGIPLGHGVGSMFLANKVFTLTPEEACAVRWHMGEYNVADNEMNELHNANAHNPLCYLIQFADRLACVDY